MFIVSIVGTMDMLIGVAYKHVLMHWAL